MRQKQLKTVLIAFCALFLFGTNCLAQHKNEISVYAGFLQLKEELNQKMVYQGPQIGFHYQRNWFFEKWELRYNPKIALGVPFNRGMIGINVNFVPIDFSGIKTVCRKDNHEVRLGLNFATNFSHQAYPDQHSGNLFWHGEIGIAPCVEYNYRWDRHKIKVFLQNSVAGFVSRTKEVAPYFYTLRISDLFTNRQALKNMQFGSFDKYNHTKAFVEYVPNISGNHSFAFGMEYIDSYFSNRFKSLNYYLQWKRSF